MNPLCQPPCRTARGRRQRRGRGFTLVELLVVMVVLVLMLLLLTQLTNNTALNINAGVRQIDVEGEARLVLDRLAYDIGGMVHRPDIDYTFSHLGGSQDDFLSFYAEALPGTLTTTAPTPAPTASPVPSTVSVLGYRINTDTSSMSCGRLERAAKDLSSTGLTFAPLRGGVYAPLFIAPNTVPLIEDGYYRVLGNQVFRFQFCFLCNDPSTGKVSLYASMPSGAGTSDLKALVVAVAVLDSKGRTNIPPVELKVLHDGLPGYADASALRDVATVWTNAVNNPNYAAGVPSIFRQAVHIYQRYYYLQ